jgi:hypothetical protein
MAIHFERRPAETAACAAATALRLGFEPLEQACAALGRIALLRFNSAEAEADFAEQLRELAQNLRHRATADGATARSLLKGIRELEKTAIILASSET